MCDLRRITGDSNAHLIAPRARKDNQLGFRSVGMYPFDARKQGRYDCGMGSTPEKKPAGPDAPRAAPSASPVEAPLSTSKADSPASTAPELTPGEPVPIAPLRGWPRLWPLLWGWAVIGTVVAACLVIEAAQVATSGHRRIADWLCALGGLLFCFKFLTCKKVRIRTSFAVRIIVCACLVTLSILLIISNHWLPARRTRLSNNLKLDRVVRLPYAGHGQLDYNVYFHYAGVNPARVVFLNGAVILDRKPASEVELDFIESFDWDSFLKSAQLRPMPEGSTFAPKSRHYITVHVDLSFEGVTPDERLKALTVDDTAMVLLFGVAKWKDATGSYATEVCTANLNEPDVFLPCKAHNGPMTPTQ
jgi:hypothetical protein